MPREPSLSPGAQLINAIYAAALGADAAALLRAAAPLIGAAIEAAVWIGEAESTPKNKTLASWRPDDRGEAWTPEAPSRQGHAVKVQGAPRYLIAAEGELSAENAELLAAASRALEQALALRADSPEASARRRFLSDVSHEIRTPLNGIVGSIELLAATELEGDQLTFLDALRSSAGALMALIDDLARHRELPLKAEREPAEPTAPEAPRAEAPPPSGRELRVLLVEDDPTNRAVARGMLEGLPCIVEEATNGVEAVRCTETKAFDIILMDRRMPRLDGLAATEIIRAREASTGRRRATILAMTADALPGDRERCLAAGMDDYLSKPVTRAALESKIASLVGDKGGAGRVLVVDDDPINRKVVGRLLENLGVASVEADGGESALAILGQQDFDFVLMDCWMPDRDGVEVTELIRARRGADPPIIALTADASAENRERCRSAGMNDFLTKPLRRQEVLDLVERYIGPAQKDWDGIGYLANLGIEGDAAAEVLLEHVASVSARLIELENAIEGDDSESIRFLAHTIAGECGIVGNEDGAEASRSLEKTSPAGTPIDERRQRFQTLKSSFEKSRARVMAALGKL